MFNTFDASGNLYLVVATESILGTAIVDRVALSVVKEETAPCVFARYSHAAKNEKAGTNETF